MLKLSILDQVRLTPTMSPGDALRASILLARTGDELGFERYWIAEHHDGGVACSCPEVLLGRVGAETSRIRIGAGGVLLPHYSALKVVETFRTLQSLYPGRIDLGIGRAQGCGDTEMHALRRFRVDRPYADDFEEQLSELIGFARDALPANHPFVSIKVSPALQDDLPIWLLGSSSDSADLAARLQLPYAFAQFISPVGAGAAMAAYHRLSSLTAISQSIIAVGCICLETESEVRDFTSEVARSRGAERPLSDARRTTVSSPAPKACYVGTPEVIHRHLLDIATSNNVSELMLLVPFGEPEIALNSFRLVAKTFGLTCSGGRVSAACRSERRISDAYSDARQEQGCPDTARQHA